MYAFAPEKPPSLVGRNFCLAILWSASILTLRWQEVRWGSRAFEGSQTFLFLADQCGKSMSLQGYHQIAAGLQPDPVD
jgi:hypothetical protein